MTVSFIQKGSTLFISFPVDKKFLEIIKSPFQESKLSFTIPPSTPGVICGNNHFTHVRFEREDAVLADKKFDTYCINLETYPLGYEKKKFYCLHCEGDEKKETPKKNHVTHCNGKTRKGEDCRNKIKEGEKYCHLHNPNRKEKLVVGFTEVFRDNFYIYEREMKEKVEVKSHNNNLPNINFRRNNIYAARVDNKFIGGEVPYWINFCKEQSRIQGDKWDKVRQLDLNLLYDPSRLKNAKHMKFIEDKPHFGISTLNLLGLSINETFSTCTIIPNLPKGNMMRETIEILLNGKKSFPYAELQNYIVQARKDIIVREDYCQYMYSSKGKTLDYMCLGKAIHFKDCIMCGVHYRGFRKTKDQFRKEDMWNFFVDEALGGHVKCVVCEKKLYCNTVQYGHNIANVRGGGYNKENIFPICKGCNIKQGSKDGNFSRK